MKISEQYKKAYNHADMICNYMPDMLEGMTISEGEPSEYTKGFGDRVQEYRKTKEAIKEHSLHQLKKEYRGRKEFKTKGKDKSRGLEKE